MEISNTATLPTKFGNFIIQSFKEIIDTVVYEHLVLKTKELRDNPLVRIHSECLTGDVFRSKKCDCGDELELAMKRISLDYGLIIYLRQEGRGIGLFNKVNAYNLQDSGLDTIEANEKLGFANDMRSYNIVGNILNYFNISEIRLLTNNPSKVDEIAKFVKVTRESIIVDSNKYNEKYLKVKKEKMGHFL